MVQSDGLLYLYFRDLFAPCGSAGGPAHRSPAEQVQVQMLHRLTAVRPRIEDETIALAESPSLRELACRGDHVAEQVFVLRHRFAGGGDVQLGNYESMYRGLRMNVRKGDHSLVFIEASRR